MCAGAKFRDKQLQKDWTIYFPNPKAALPVTLEDGAFEWVKWGRRKEEQVSFVQGGWARLDSINEGKWDRYNPVIVNLAVESFMEKDADKVSHWVDVPQGMAIQALIVEGTAEKRLYVVTEDTPAEYSWVHDRWPRLVSI